MEQIRPLVAVFILRDVCCLIDNVLLERKKNGTRTEVTSSELKKNPIAQKTPLTQKL